MDHRKDIVKDKVKITVNGKEYYAKHITVKNGLMFLDGKYIGPEDIENIIIEDD